MIYDPKETEISRMTLLDLLGRIGPDPGLGIVGGWAIHALVGENFRRATGRDYLRSRDIDVFIDCRGDLPRKFKRILDETGFVPGEYEFRYTLIFDRESLEPLGEEEAEERQLFDLLYIYLDILGNAKTEELGTMESDLVGEIVRGRAVKAMRIDNEMTFVPREDFLFLLKAESFLNRKSKEKRMKDICDIYALLFYSEARDKIAQRVRPVRGRQTLAKETLEMILESEAPDFLAAELFQDEFKAGLVRRNLRRAADEFETWLG